MSWWSGEGDATDREGLNNGTRIGGVGFAAGKVGQAFLFTAGSQVVQMSDSPSLNPTNSISIEGWFYLNTFNSSQGIALVEKGGGYDSVRQYELGMIEVGTNWYFRPHVWRASGLANFQGATAVLLHAWYHVAMTYDGTNLALYVNGHSDGTMAVSGQIVTSTNPLWIGGDLEGPWNMTGMADEVSLYNRALTAAEIQGIYNAGSAGKCTPTNPPDIVSQPSSLSVGVGANARFTVGATGTAPLSYQWEYDGTNINGATASALTVVNAQVTDTGSYSVTVSNAYGSVTSSNAQLTVNVANCVGAPPGVISWWAAEGNALDQMDANNGTLVNGVGFAPGKVGQAFLFTAANQVVQMSNSPSLNPTNAISIEGWFYLNSFNSSSAMVLVEKGGGGDQVRQYELGMIQVGTSWYFRPHVWLPGGLAYFQGATAAQLNTWYHVAMTYDGTNLVLYVNGNPDGTIAASGPIVTSTHPLWIGGDLEGTWPMPGMADEVSLYGRALSATEVQAIYNAGSAGKCQATNPPVIFAQPASLNLIAGATAAFSVGASGFAPLGYQWQFDGTNITGATAASLTISNIQSANVGLYSVTVSNPYGVTISSNAALAVVTPPFITSQPTNLEVMSGASATFTVGAGGDSPLSYQWQLNSTILPGATNSSLTIGSAQSSDAGTYRVVVSNPFGSVLSSNAVLTVDAMPAILVQPADTTVTAGNSAFFAVTANGSTPLAYQWTFDGTNISGATGSIFTVANAQMADAGSYSVTVTNAYGSVTSSSAQLTVNAVNCLGAPAGLISWWAAEGNALDQMGVNNGTLVNRVGFAPGKVDQAFSFTAANQVVQVSNSPSLNPTNAISIEGWFNLSAYPSSAFVLVEKGGGGDPDRQYELGTIQIGTNWYFRPHVWLPGGLVSFPGATPAQLHTWYHVAMTYDGTNLALYVNGNPDGTMAASGPIATSAHPLWIGGDLEGGPWQMLGLADEVSLYGQALSAADVQAIYNAGSAGKCKPPAPPTIYAQPANLSVVQGSNAVFAVGVAGTVPFTYQWEYNGTNIDGATDTSLTISNVQPSNSGYYSVVVSNSVGSATSSNALLTVTLPPSIIQVISVTATSGIVTVPINLIAQGDENALGFSLNFNKNLLSFIGVNLGDGASGGGLLYNANLASAGKLGVAISLPPNSTFNSGTQVVANVSFFVAAVTNSQVAPVTFGDQPILRQVVGPNANILPASYVAGSVTIPSVTNASFGIEGDVSPAPSGDGAVTIADWVQEGRYVAHLDAITDPGLFERADCAPRSTLGDGQLTIADWVQVGRYSLGLDPLTPAGGPSTPSGVGIPSGYAPFDAGQRALTVVPPPFAVAGQPFTASIRLTSLGDENALGFSLNFDTNVLAFSGMNVGSNAAGSLFNANSYQATNGQIAVALSLPVGEAFAVGTQEVARVTFVISSSSTGATSLAFGNSPVPCQIVDSYASALTTSYANGTITITPLTTTPTLQLALTPDDHSVVVSWPAGAVGFNLESTTDLNLGGWSGVTAALVTNTNTISATVTITNAQQFFRLHHQ